MLNNGTYKRQNSSFQQSLVGNFHYRSVVWKWHTQAAPPSNLCYQMAHRMSAVLSSKSWCSTLWPTSEYLHASSKKTQEQSTNQSAAKREWICSACNITIQILPSNAILLSTEKRDSTDYVYLRLKSMWRRFRRLQLFQSVDGWIQTHKLSVPFLRLSDCSFHSPNQTTADATVRYDTTGDFPRRQIKIEESKSFWVKSPQPCVFRRQPARRPWTTAPAESWLTIPSCKFV